MNKGLWEKILQFDFDGPPTEYGFSTRLANENYWTKHFTKEAILEYKKFMYLAASSDFMVSPSEVVDVVWHQHLIFTQSYHEFCNLIGKQVQHIPSTHNKEEREKFRLAKERTARLYRETFGQQPSGIWGYEGMYETLQLDKARFKLRTVIIAGMLGFLLMTLPFYFILKPLYVTIDNPDFILGLGCLTLLVFVGLEIFNRKKLSELFKDADKDSFIYNLQPLELVYLQTQKLSHVINGTVNELITGGTIKVDAYHMIALTSEGSTNSIEQLQVINTLNELGKTYYPSLLQRLVEKPIFSNTENCMKALKKYIIKSKKFGELFYINFALFSLLLMIALTRLETGILRDKPVTFIAIIVIALTVLINCYLFRLTKLPCTLTIPEMYKNDLLPQRQIENDWQWSYFLLGSAVLSTSFVPLTEYVDKHNSGDGGTGSSCGSSCGGSGGGCGGCGGGD